MSCRTHSLSVADMKIEEEQNYCEYLDDIIKSLHRIEIRLMLIFWIGCAIFGFLMGWFLGTIK